MKTLRRAIACLAVLAWMPASSAIDVQFEKDSGLPIVILNVAVKTGSVSDPEGQYGVSNFLGEMLLRGTRSRTKAQIDLELDQIGARIDIETRAEALILRGSALSSQLEPFLKILGELITQPSFPETEIRKLRAEEVSKLLEERGSDSTLALRYFSSNLFGQHPYGKPVNGRIADIERLTRDKLLTHYDRLFRDEQLLIVGSGDADPDQVIRWSKSIAQARPGSVIIPQVSPPPAPASRRLFIIDKPDRTQTQIYGGLIGVRPADAKFFPLYLANQAFGGSSFSARLTREIRVERGWSYGAYSYFRFGRQPRSWQFHFYPASKYTPEALSHVIGLVTRLHADGITREEFDFNRNALVQSAGFMYNTPKKRVENLLLERTLDLPEGFMKSYAARLAPLTLEEVNAVTREYFDPARLSITVVGTARDLKDALAKSAGVDPSQAQIIPFDRD